jgi:uncharacterized protein (DUF58 family)
VKAIKTFFLGVRFFYLLAAVIVLFIIGYFSPLFYSVAQVSFAALMFATLSDILVLYVNKKGFFAYRETPLRLSNGDPNEIKIFLTNLYSFKTYVEVIDEIPFQFQIRDFMIKSELEPGVTKHLIYNLRPVERGEYSFGEINVFVSSPLMLVRKRYRFEGKKIIPVYPSYLQMRKYEIFAISDRLSEIGVKKIRRIGHSQEFEQIQDYVRGDDYRTINWKATARKRKLMVNHFEDERSQQVYSLIDIGRVMKMPFNKMSLLDYAINASLVLSNVALRKSDKAGMVTFSNKVDRILAADKQALQMQKILDLLYNQKTDFLETDFENLAAAVLRKITQRSLFLVFTNFETLNSLKRQLPFIKRLAGSHLVVVIFFQNTELLEFIDKPATTIEEIYHKTIAEKFSYEKRQIVKELERFNIHSILTSPENLTIETLNKYLELKARGLI